MDKSDMPVIEEGQEKEASLEVQEEGDSTRNETEMEDANITESDNKCTEDTLERDKDESVLEKDNANNYTKSDKIDDQNIDMELEKVANLLKLHSDKLKTCHLRDYPDLDVLKLLQKDLEIVVVEACKRLSELTGRLRSVHDNAHVLYKLTDRKLEEEGLLSWVKSQTPEKDKELVAEEKEYLANAATIRKSVSENNKEIAELDHRIQTLEAESQEALAVAVKARREADIARRIAEEARVAAEEKARSEEEANRKAEEARKKKELEEQKEREEEERRLKELKTKGISAEDDERMREEQARKDPANWPSWVFSVDSGDVDIPVGCVIRAMPDSVDRDKFSIDVLDQSTRVFQLSGHEELVSHIVSIRYTDPDYHPKLAEPLSVCLAHCSPRNVPSREPVIKRMRNDGTWAELPTNDVIIPDMKEYKFVEARLEKPTTVAVVFRFKREEHMINKKGGKVTPSVDPRICLTFQKGQTKTNFTVTTEIHPIELSTVSDVKMRRRQECERLLASSPIVNVSLSLRKLTKPVNIVMPVPPNPNKHKRERPSTASSGDRRGSKAALLNSRPKSAFFTAVPKKEEGDEDQVCLLTCDSKGNWVALSDIQINQPKNKDLVIFDIKEPMKKLLVLRTKPETPLARLEKIATSLEMTLKQRSVQLILGQKSDDPSDVMLQCTTSQRIERNQRKMAEEGYDEGPSPSKELIMHEGQILKVKFRGNIHDVNDKDLKMSFNTQIKAKSTFTVHEVDKFAQKSIDCYRGFAQVFTPGMVKRLVPRDEEAAKQKNPPMKEVLEEGDVLLCELLISLPKPLSESHQPIYRAPVIYKSDGVVDESMLRQLAGEMGEEWKKLANHLNIRRMRLQAIMRQNVNNNNEDAIFDMLITWAKKVPRSLNKVDILCTGLVACGRYDLEEMIRDRDCEFRQERTKSTRDAVLKKAFGKVCQNAQTCTNWRNIGRSILLPNDALDRVEAENDNDRERCYQMLLCWKEDANEEATVKVLTKHLRRLKYHSVAEQVMAVA